jgi:membrane-associated phospholipid phosphatase
MEWKPSPTLLDYVFWILFVVGWSLTIGVSRVYLGFHTFQDVFVGWTFGFIWSYFMEFYLIPFIYTAAINWY